MGALHTVALLVLATALGIALLQSPPARDVEDTAVMRVEVELGPELEGGGAAQRLAGALRFPTHANPDAPNHLSNPAPFQQLHEYLERSYPLVYEKLQHERVSSG